MQDNQPLELDSQPVAKLRASGPDSDLVEVDIPLDYLAMLVEEVLERDLLSPSKTQAVLQAATGSLGRLGCEFNRYVH